MEEDREKRKRRKLNHTIEEPEQNSHQDFRATVQPIAEVAESQGFVVAYDTRKAVEENGQMGGRTIYRARDGRAIVVDRIPLCDACSNPDMGKPYVCHKCGRKICEDCWVHFSGVYLCKLCLMRQEPLDKREFKILLAVANEVVNTGKIARAVRTRKEEVQLAIGRLYGNDYIMLSDGIFHKRYMLTERGEEVLEAYQKIYGTCFDIFAFSNRLRE